jgi:hypothetical protein
VNAALALARRYGVAVSFADLGSWEPHELRSEYDPRGPEIRLNLRVAQRLSPPEFDEFLRLAVGHELYHHREHIGEITVIGDRTERERAAIRYANDLARTQA